MEQINKIQQQIKELQKKQKELKKKEELKRLKELEKYLFYIDLSTYERLEKEVLGKEVEIIKKDEQNNNIKEKRKVTKAVLKKAISRRLSFVSFDLKDFE